MSSAARASALAADSARELHPVVREEAARIATEAMLNALHHSDAKTIEVEISYERRQLRINVRDDGRGMDESVTRAGREGHFGFMGCANERSAFARS